MAGLRATPVVYCQEILKELDDYYEKFRRESDAIQKRRLLQFIQRALIRSQELGDDKIQIVSQMVELVENRTRQVDSHVELFETCQDLNDSTTRTPKISLKNEALSQTEKASNKRSRRQRNNENRENATINHDHEDLTSGTPKEKKPKTSKKKKRSKAKAEREASPADLPIDPNEPTYCLCNQVSYGEMIGCDNEECPIEWFHFSCVGLNHKPKGKWYCPECRGENEKTMGKALEKSKKERAYNRMQEEHGNVKITPKLCTLYHLLSVPSRHLSALTDQAEGGAHTICVIAPSDLHSQCGETPGRWSGAGEWNADGDHISFEVILRGLYDIKYPTSV
ncbi:unnamed protein product [Ranitomeya imitator]|uniref:Inhibitor of growth protein n=1 Tax=Ranitomeya imitator TaxID=111125 RepID=A0ABN9LSD3_9NEOB|nr:unnamed protein product [Ranitomeya imitator]